MNPVLQATVIRLGGVEALTEAVNGRIREIEARQGIPAANSRAMVHPTTVRSWLRKTGPPRYPIVTRAVCEVSGHTAEQLWPPASVEDVNRRQFLAHAAGAVGAGTLGAGALGGSLLAVITELGAAPSPNPDEYSREAARLWRDCWTAEPSALAYAAADHAERGQTLLARARGIDHRRIADAVGLSTVLVGRIAFFDLGRPQTSEQVWHLAGQRLEGSADHPLLACLYGHMTFVPGWAGDWEQAERHLQIAAGHARRGGGSGLRSWLHAVAAECLSRSGRLDDALARIERARETIAENGAYPDPWWLDYYSADRLNGFDAAVCLTVARAVLSRPATARATRHALDRVERALGQLQPAGASEAEFTPQDCVTVLDRATAHALVHDDQRALQLAEAACRCLGRRPYHAAATRLDTLADVLPASRVGELHEIERTYLRAA
jgi:hypothetical protein